MSSVLLIDDDNSFRASLAETISDLGHEVLEAAGGAAGLSLLDTELVDAVFLDLRMPGQDGISVLHDIRARPALASVPVVVLTAFADSDNTITAMKLGAYDHLTKPVGRSDVEKMLARVLPRNKARASSAEAGKPGALLGASPKMREVQKLIGMAAGTDVTVLISGETGTGKELVARSLHSHSARASKPFIAINCAAIPAELLEGQLFGYKRGSFTGAVADSMGLLREADGGTLLLDEIGDMPQSMQSKILRVLEERVVSPLGSSRATPLDIRIVAATHRNLADLVGRNEFRQDLWFRLNVLNIALPPLRERTEDVVPLAEHFLRMANPLQPKTLSLDATRRLLAHSWPGNVRELKNAMERTSVVVRGPTIDAGDLDFLAGSSAAAGAASLESLLGSGLEEAVSQLEKLMIERALVECGNNRAAAARRLGINRQFLYTKLKRYGIDAGAESEAES
ncbi:MAG TPA: sigma-54 dependent transcriptional regulator [Solimonas sp.]|nr:sigma-54 dependent transcriptional regulator [Solimonas sp.]